MNDDIRDDLINGVKKVHYAYLRLSDKQAQQIYAMEEEDRAVHPYIGMLMPGYVQFVQEADAPTAEESMMMSLLLMG
jgi:hypothetical protein